MDDDLPLPRVPRGTKRKKQTRLTALVVAELSAAGESPPRGDGPPREEAPDLEGDDLEEPCGRRRAAEAAAPRRPAAQDETRLSVGNLPSQASDGLITQFVEEAIGGDCEVTVVRRERVFAFVTTARPGAVETLDGAELMGKKVVARVAHEMETSTQRFKKNLLANYLARRERDAVDRRAEERRKEREAYVATEDYRDAEARKRHARAEGHLGYGFTSDGSRPRLHAGYAHFDV